LNGLSVFVGLILFFTTLDSSQSAGAVALQIFGFTVGVWILIYLFRPGIRDLFHGGGSSEVSVVAGLSSAVPNAPSR
jgi:hypothetical protein